MYIYNRSECSCPMVNNPQIGAQPNLALLYYVIDYALRVKYADNDTGTPMSELTGEALYNARKKIIGKAFGGNAYTGEDVIRYYGEMRDNAVQNGQVDEWKYPPVQQLVEQLRYAAPLEKILCLRVRF